MCIRGSHPLRHYVCLPCRASFKKSNIPERTHHCPRCRQVMIDAGQDLPAPKHRDREGWKLVEILLSHGVTFHSSCCDGPGWRPRQLRDVKARLEFAQRHGLSAKDVLTARDPDELLSPMRHTARPEPAPGFTTGSGPGRLNPLEMAGDGEVA